MLVSLERAKGIAKQIGRDADAQFLRLATPDRSDIIVDATGTVISRNKYHLGVKIGNKVFDPLHPDGIAVEAWVKSFRLPLDDTSLVLQSRDLSEFFKSRLLWKKFSRWASSGK